MSNPEEDDLDNYEEQVADLFAEMLGATFSRSADYDPATGVATEWTRRDDGLYYARVDTLQPSGLERFIRDDQEYDSRDNFITEQRTGGQTVSVGYAYGAPNEPDRFRLKIASQHEEARTSFLASYTPEGTLADFQIELKKQPQQIEEGVTDGFPEKRLEEVVDLYRLKGLSAFEPVLPSDLGGEIDLSGAVPQLVLGTWLPKRGYTNEDIDTVMTLAAIPVDYHLSTAKALDRVPQNDADTITEFLKVITARNLIPPVVHKNNRKLLHRFEDIDPSTIEGLDSLMGWYKFSISSFLDEYNRSIERSGEFITTFTPSLNGQESFKFAIEQMGMYDREVIHEQTVSTGELVRYERNTYQVDCLNDEQILTIRDIFTPDKSSCTVKFPRLFDTKAFQEAIDTDDVESWKDGFDFIPFSFEATKDYSFYRKK